MSVVTLRITEEKHARLKQLAANRHTSVNKLLDELATIALVQHDLMVQFRAAADAGDPARGLALLDKLERGFANIPESEGLAEIDRAVADDRAKRRHR